MRKLLAVVVALSVVIGIPSASAQAPSEVWGEDVKGLSKATGMSLTEAWVYSTKTTAVGRVAEVAETLYADTFAGIWRTPDDGRVMVAFTSNAEANRDVLASSFPWPDDLVARTADASLRTLRKLRERIAEDMPALNGEGVPVRGVATDEEANVVDVTIDFESPEARQRLRERYGDRLFVTVRTVRPALSIADLCYTRGYCTDYMRAGVELQGPTAARLSPPESGIAACTSGFVGSVSGRAALLTAGHCFANGGTVRHADEGVGIVLDRCDGEYYTTRPATMKTTKCAKVDAETVSVDTINFPPTNRVYYSDSEKDRRITRVIGRDGVPLERVGDPVCRTGISSTAQCGTIKWLDWEWGYSYNSGYIMYDEQRQVNACALPGDSGGPALYGSTAYGVVSAMSTTKAGGVPEYYKCSDMDPGTVQYSYTAITHAENSLGFRVRTTS